MKHLLSIFLVLFIFIGCITIEPQRFTTGKNFPIENIEKIKKKETTKSDLISLFGQPAAKDVKTENTEKWVYQYSEGVTTFIDMKAKTTGFSRTLDILLENDIVINYAYTENPSPYPMNVE